MVAVMDKHQKLLIVEGEIMHKMGYAERAFEGKYASALLPPERHKIASGLYERMLRGERFTRDWELSGNYYIVHFAPLLDENNAIYAVW